MNQRRYQPSLIILRSFECAARHESFTAAARELNLTQSAISRHIRDLEETLGLTLFRRVGRRVLLTQAGSGFAARLTSDLDRIEQTVMRTVASGNEKTSLRIATLPTFATRWLIPRLPDFEAAHPAIEIMLSTRLEPFDLIREQFDLAIHFGQETWPDARLTWLSGEEMIAVAAPAFLEQHKIGAPADLLKAPLLHLETRPDAWPDWFRGATRTEVKALSGKRFDQFSMIIEGALSSLGAALVPKFLVRGELETRSLIQVSDFSLKTSNSYYVVRPASDADENADLFVKWVQEKASQDSMEK